MTPLLILVFDVKPVLAVGTDLMYGAITKTAGGYKHLTQKTVDVRLSLVDGRGLGAGGRRRRPRPGAARIVARKRLRQDAARPRRGGGALRGPGGGGARPARLPPDERRARVGHARPPLQARRRGRRRGGGFHPRRHVRGLGSPDRRGPDPDLQTDTPPGGRHGRFPRGDPVVGGRPGAPGVGERGLGAGRQPPPRIGAGDLDRQHLLRPDAWPGPPRGTRGGADRLGARPELEGGLGAVADLLRRLRPAQRRPSPRCSCVGGPRHPVPSPDPVSERV